MLSAPRCLTADARWPDFGLAVTPNADNWCALLSNSQAGKHPKSLAGERAYISTDQKVGGSSPSERAQVKGPSQSWKGPLLTRLVTATLPSGRYRAGEDVCGFGELVADDVGVHAQCDRGVRVAEPGGRDMYGDACGMGGLSGGYQRRSRRSSRRSRRSSRRSCRRSIPCVTTAAVPTTAAVRATGAPMTPRRAMRAGRKGISSSFRRLVGFE